MTKATDFDKIMKRHSKFLSLVLRHQPETIGITLDENGWVDVQVLIDALASKGKLIGLTTLQTIVETNDKKRFAFSEDGKSIRASQGHSVDVDLKLEPSTPPNFLFHGTLKLNMKDISEGGLKKMNRNHVHLSEDIKTARTVGSRRGKAIVLTINIQQMIRDGHTFYLSDNGVWLTDNVPYEYICGEN